MNVHALVPKCEQPREQCFELFRVQNFWAYRYPSKITGYGTVYLHKNN